MKSKKRKYVSKKEENGKKGERNVPKKNRL